MSEDNTVIGKACELPTLQEALAQLAVWETNRCIARGLHADFQRYHLLLRSTLDTWFASHPLDTAGAIRPLQPRAVVHPIPMILSCPGCGKRHIDPLGFKAHHTHACQHCGVCWRPAIVDTEGVQFLPGFLNTCKPNE